MVKRNSRFNAVTLGLFADVIPTCDGDKAEREFALLHDEMHQEFGPLGVEMGIFRYEEHSQAIRLGCDAAAGTPTDLTSV